MESRFQVQHTGQTGNDYGVYDTLGGSSPIASGMTEMVANGVAGVLNHFDGFGPDNFDQVAYYDAAEAFVATFGQ